jgi:hypothetical protein
VAINGHIHDAHFEPPSFGRFVVATAMVQLDTGHFTANPVADNVDMNMF